MVPSQVVPQQYPGGAPQQLTNHFPPSSDNFMGQPPSQIAGYAQPPVIYASPANQAGQQFASPDDG